MQDHGSDQSGQAHWWIIAQVAKRMGFDGFEEAAERSKGTVHDYSALVEMARNRYRYKLGKGTVRKTGGSMFKHTMSFAPRNLT